MARGRELFPADRGLQVRMVTASVLTPLIVLVAVAAVVLVAPTRFAIFLGIAALIGIAVAVRAVAERQPGRELPASQAPELHAATERLCALACLSKPRVVLNHERQPNSWVVARPWRPAELHVTDGLLALLAPAELEAVVAHELSHLAHRDAMVMTVVGGPGTVLLEGGAPLLRGGWWLMPGGFLAVAIGWVARLGTNALSRYRELAADAGAAALTGHPALLAAALAKVSGGLERIPSADLRAVAGRDAFHLLPVAEDDARPWFHRGGGATHPSVARRIARLEAMERTLHGARLPSPIDR